MARSNMKMKGEGGLLGFTVVTQRCDNDRFPASMGPVGGPVTKAEPHPLVQQRAFHKKNY